MKKKKAGVVLTHQQPRVTETAITILGHPQMTTHVAVARIIVAHIENQKEILGIGFIPIGR